MRGPPRQDYGPPMGQPYHDPHCEDPSHTILINLQTMTVYSSTFLAHRLSGLRLAGARCVHGQQHDAAICLAH